MQWALGKNVKCTFLGFFFFFGCEHFWVLIVKKKKKKERKEERDIKHNEKDTFTPIFNGEKGEVGNGGLTEVT